MQTILITGGTTFVSKYTASYFVQHGYEVYVLNRGNKEQVPGVHLIKCDRHDTQKLKKTRAAVLKSLQKFNFLKENSKVQVPVLHTLEHIFCTFCEFKTMFL